MFVFYESNALNHIGKTLYYVTEDRERYFDFVQELLNQVVPRKRALVNVEGSIAGGVYSLITEDGKYGISTRDALNAFKTNFGMATRPFGNMTAAFTNNNDRVNYEPADDTSPVFRKLTKDYNHRTNPAAAEPYLHQIIDQGTLMGTRDSDQDVYINGIPANMVNDTGLYELYRNVVKKFVNSMIRLCESYRDNSQPTNDIQGWVSRWVSGVTHTVTGSPQPVSYSYGGRRTVSQFNSEVSKHGAPRSFEMNDNNNPHHYYQQYNANLVDASMNEPNQMYRDHGILGQGNKRWPGLFKKSPNPFPDDFEEYESGTTDHDNPAHKEWFEWEKWTGIDCIGLTLQALRYAERPRDYAANQLISDPVDLPVPGIRIADVCCRVNGTWGSLHHSDAEPAGTLYNTNVNNFFNQANRNLLYYWEPAQVIGAERLIHKGDFIKYGSTHITNVYSERVQIVGNQIRYQIIHAYGAQAYQYPDWDMQSPLPIFSRKVMKTWQNITANLTGFGRIKLWD